MSATTDDAWEMHGTGSRGEDALRTAFAACCRKQRYGVGDVVTALREVAV
jgi:hypothetical protein